MFCLPFMYACRFYWFEVLECGRRLLLASVIGIVSLESSAAPVLGLLISLGFIQVFNARPFKNEHNNNLGLVLQYSLTLLFVAGLMIKLDEGGAIVNDDQEDQKVFGIVLLVILSFGPLSIIFQSALSYFSVGHTLLTPPTNKEEDRNESLNIINEPNKDALKPGVNGPHLQKHGSKF